MIRSDNPTRICGKQKVTATRMFGFLGIQYCYRYVHDSPLPLKKDDDDVMSWNRHFHPLRHPLLQCPVAVFWNQQ